MRKPVWVILMVVALIAVGCGPAMQPAAAPQTDSGEVFTVALPRIIVDFDANGNPSIGNFGISTLRDWGLVAKNQNVTLPPEVIQAMTNANIQNIELRQTGQGIVVFVNGKAMPYVGWTDEGLAKLSALAGLFGQNQQAVQIAQKFLPIVRRLGLDLVLTFPVKPGADKIALANPDEVVKAAASPSKNPASAVVQFEVKYDDQGVPGILGITASDLAALGIRPAIALKPETLQTLQANNIQTVELRSKGDGIYLYVNGDPLPYIAWDEKLMGNAADLAVQTMPDTQKWVAELIKMAAPALTNTDVAVMVHFPVAEGQKPIVAKMHW